MSEELRRQTEEWFIRGQHDLETAQLLLEHGGHPEAIAVHLQQALEKCLKGWLVWHEQEPPRTHDLMLLLHRATQHNPSLQEFTDLCDRATAYYLEDRYPPGSLPQYTYGQLTADFEEVSRLVNRLRRETTG